MRDLSAPRARDDVSESIQLLLNRLRSAAIENNGVVINGTTRQRLAKYVRGDYLALLHRHRFEMTLRLSTHAYLDFENEVQKGLAATVAYELTK